MRMISWRRIAIVSVIIFSVTGFGAIALQAQTDTGSISGVVTDPSGAVVAGATVILENRATGVRRDTSTNAAGVYSAPNTPPGQYTLTVSKPGFKTTAISGIHIEVQRSATANVQLEIGEAVSRVTVSATTANVQTTSPSVTQSLSTQPIVQLPTSGRQILSLVTLAPGTAPASVAQVNAGDSNFYGTTSNQISVAGMPDMSTLFLQDGVQNVNMVTLTMNIQPSIESLEEVKTTMNGADARYSEPSVVNIVTKSGTNSFHGTVYDFLQNDALNARAFFTAATSPKPTVRYNLFGGNFGGPILKEKVFGFFDYSGLRSSVGGPALAIVPTPAERRGDFSADPTIYNPLTFNAASTPVVQPFAGNVIPANMINPFAAQWMQLYPLPNLNPAVSRGFNYGTNISNTANYDEILARGDWNISAMDHLYGSILHLNSPNVSPTIIRGLFGATHTNVGTNATLEQTHVFSGTMVNTAKIGYNRANYFLSQQAVGLKNYAQAYGLTNVSALPSQSAPPTIGISNISSFGNPYTPQGDIQNRFQFEDELDLTRGKHMLSMGGEIIREQYFGNWTINNNAQYSFSGAMTALYTVDPTTGNVMESKTDRGNGLADLMLGFPTSGSHSLGVVAAHFFSTTIAGYVEDHWKFTPKLTLDLGVRYSIFTPPTTGAATSYNFAKQKSQPGAWPTNYGDLGPRFGFAYALRPRIVVRGAYGIYYTENCYNNEQFMLTYPPYFVSQGYTKTVENPAAIQDLFLPPPIAGTRAYTNNPGRMKDTSVQQWNLTTESQLTQNTTLTAAYVGNVGRHATARYDGNEPTAASPGSLILNVLPIPSLGQPIMTQADFLNSSYNALMLTVSSHFRNGLSILANYTWGRAFGYADGDNSLVETIYNLHTIYGPLGFDRPQVLHFSGVYQLPFGPGKQFLGSDAWWNHVLGDWQVSGIWSIASQPPASVGAPNLTSSSFIGPFYADRICDPNSGNFTRTLGHWFNTSCFIQPPAGQYGSGSSTGIRGPHSNNVDFSLSKIVPIPVWEESRLQIRADFFNLFNHPQFLLGSQSLTSPSFGAIAGALPQRAVQLSLRFSF